MKIDLKFTIPALFLLVCLSPALADQSVATVRAYGSFADKVGVLNAAIAKANHDTSQAEIAAALADFADGLGPIVASMRSTAAGRSAAGLSSAEQAAIQRARDAMASLQEMPKSFQWCIGSSAVHDAWEKIVSIMTNP